MEVYYLGKRYTSVCPEAALGMTNNGQNLYMYRPKGEYGVSRIIMQMRTTEIHTPRGDHAVDFMVPQCNTIIGLLCTLKINNTNH